MTNLNDSMEELKPSNSGELDDTVMLELRDVARKAQIDYVAVNHPNGIRHGESPELLAEFLKVNHERIMEWHDQELTKARKDGYKQGMADDKRTIEVELTKARLEGFTTDPKGVSLHKESYLRGELNMLKSWVYMFDAKYDGIPFIEDFRAKWKDDHALIKDTLTTQLKGDK